MKLMLHIVQWKNAIKMKSVVYEVYVYTQHMYILGTVGPRVSSPVRKTYLPQKCYRTPTVTVSYPYLLVRRTPAHECTLLIWKNGLWRCSPHFPRVGHRPAVIARVAGERRITSEAECMKSAGREHGVELVSVCARMRGLVCT